MDRSDIILHSACIAMMTDDDRKTSLGTQQNAEQSGSAGQI